MASKIRDFINVNARCYHGALSLEKSVEVLKSHKQQTGQYCYLIRNTSDPFPKECLPDTAASFTISFTANSPDLGVQHIRLYVNQAGEMGIIEDKKFKACKDWNAVFESFYGFSQTSGVKFSELFPISNSSYDGLVKEEIHEQLITPVIPTHLTKQFDESIGCENKFCWKF